jgi:RNA polymerase sigma factor (sigma-70 family)
VNERLLRELAPQVLGVLVRRYGDFASAEDAVQEALLAATLHWPKDGVPDNPRGWLIQTAVRKLTDIYRAEQARRRREERMAQKDQPGSISDRDDTLQVLFLCCHPALTPPSAIALTLRAVGGLSTSEIANAFLVPEATMAQRISRAKSRIKSSDLPLGLPERADWTGRLRSVLHVLYLIFNEGYTSTAGTSLHRIELSSEAIRLARLLYGLLPDDPEVAGLLALMLLTDARRPARTGARGELVPLSEQDRDLWNRAQIHEGTALTESAFARGAIGEYQLQAAIAAVHDDALRADDTDWPQIVGLYGLLERISGNPVVSLNRAVAIAMVHGPEVALRHVDSLQERLGGNYRLDAVRAHLLEMSGDMTAAVQHFEAAAKQTTNLPERDYLIAKAAKLRSK